MNFKTWHCTSDWVENTTVLTTELSSDPPVWIVPLPLEPQMIADVLSICNIKHRLHPQVKRSFSKLFEEHGDKVSEADTLQPCLDISWISELQNHSPLSQTNPILLELATSQEDRHNVTVARNSKNHITFAPGKNLLLIHYY